MFETSLSIYAVIFPNSHLQFVLQAGIILCCLGCAIFGITEVPTDGVDFGADGNFDYTHADATTTTTAPPAAAQPAAAATPVYEPPIPSQDTTPVVPQQAQPTVDLLDDSGVVKQAPQQPDGELHDLD